jgi:hypothetical protein
MYSKNNLDSKILDNLIEGVEFKQFSEKYFFDSDDYKTSVKNNVFFENYSLIDFIRTIIYLIHKSYFIDNDIYRTKNYAFNIAKLMELDYTLKKDNPTKVLYTSVDRDLYASYLLISDHKPFIKRFKEMEYIQYGNTREEIWKRWSQIEQGKWPFFAYSMYALADGDFGQVEKLIKIAELLSTKKSFNVKHFSIHATIFEAIRDSNKDKLNENILLLIKKAHRHFNNDFNGNFVSSPAIGYLKAAWILGLEVEVNHKLIPMEMMPVKPLEKYENMYDFLLEE